MGTRAVWVSVYHTNSPYDDVIADVQRTDGNTLTVKTQAPPATGEVTVSVSSASAPMTFVYTQVSAATTWDIVHNLGYYPNVTVVDSGNNSLETDVQYISATELKVLLSAATSGKAYLS
jgi:hypothetical protein